MADYSKPAFYPRVGNIQSKNAKPVAQSPLRDDPRAMDLPSFGDVDLSVPSPLNRDLAQRMAQREASLKAQADAATSPLEKVAASLQTIGLIGSAIKQTIGSLPTRALKGKEAQEEYIQKNIYRPTQPLAYDYAGDVADALERLETEYKIPPIMPEAGALQYLVGPATSQANRAAVQQGMRAEKALEPVARGALERGGLGREAILGLTQGTGAGVIKPPGGEFITSPRFGKELQVMEDIKRNTFPYDVSKKKLAEDEKKLAEYAKSGMNEAELQMMQEKVDKYKNLVALQDWVEGNLTNYAKRQMATPNDPLRALAEKGITHLEEIDVPQTKPQYEMLARAARQEAGFPEEGMAQSPLAKQWESKSDESFNIYTAGDIKPFFKVHEDEINARQKLYDIVEKIKIEAGKKFAQENPKATPEDVFNFVRDTNIKVLGKMVGLEDDFGQAFINNVTASNKTLTPKAEIAKNNPWIAKLPDDTPVYGVNTDALEFNRIIDTLHEDLEAGRIRPEQLNKVSVEDAVRRTYEKEMAIRTEAQAQQNALAEGFPVYKEYPEGFRWIELALPDSKPQDLEVIAETPNEIVLWDAKNKKRWEDPLTGQIAFDTEEDAIKAYNKSRLNKALEFEGETMGHCVGDYCDDIAQGRTKVYSLRDPKGQSRATIEVEPQSRIGFREGEGPKTTKETFDLQTKWLEGVESGKIGEDVTFAQWWRSQHGIPEPERKLNISQIKGSGKKDPSQAIRIPETGYPEAPDAALLPYLRDFVRSGNWDEVSDLRNAGLYKVQKGQRLPGFSKEIEPGYYTLDEFKQMAAENEMPQDILDIWMKRLSGSHDYAAGGAVTFTDNKDAQLMAVEDKKFQVGGIVKSGAQAAKKSLPFFSKVDQVAKELPRTKGTGAEFMKELEKTKGVKSAEIQHRKLDEIKDMPKMTKEEFLGELEKRPPPNISETVLRQPSQEQIDNFAEKLADDEAKEFARLHSESYKEEKYLFREEKERLLEEEIDRLREDARFELTAGIYNKGDAPKFENYSLPGGENYREILLKLPSNRPSMKNMSREEYNRAVEAADKAGITNYESSHWQGEPNVIAHARVSDRIGPNGEKMLHVEEIQSDWHQKGRKHGYIDENAYQKARKKADDVAKAEGFDDAFHAAIGWKEHGILRAREASNLYDEASKLASANMVPDAPFKKNWHELMMNRILADAAENGYDRVVLTPGAVQAERYDLSKQVSGIGWNPETKTLLARRENDPLQIKHEGITAEKLADYIGKDAAEKLLKSPTNDGWHMIEGKDLAVGGVGMKGFYDKMLPDYLNSLGKKYGVQVETEGYPLSYKVDKAQAQADDQLLEQLGVETPTAEQIRLHSIKITPEMRQEFTEKGFPMYSIAAPVGLGATQIEAPQAPQPVQISDNPDAMMMQMGDREFQVGGAVKAGAKASKPAIKASEALGIIEGRPLVITQADRTKVGGKFLGGPGFSSLQLTNPEYKAAEAVWGVKTPGVAKMILGGAEKAGDKPVFTTMLGTPTQHHSNSMVFNELYRLFKKSAKEGNLDPEHHELINLRLRSALDKEGKPVFPENVDILSPKFKEIADTFDRRAIASNLMGGVSVGGKKGQIIPYDEVIKHTTDPALIDAPTGALGNRLFTLSGGVIERPDLHPAFPTILQGEDLGVAFTPVMRDLIMKDFIEKTMKEKGRAPGVWDYTRGHPPSQLITEELLTDLQKQGHKDGGLIRVKNKRKAKA